MTNLKEYQAYVIKRLKDISPFMQKFAFGNFSKMIPVPDVEDEFTERLVGISLLVEDFQELLRENERDY